MTLLRTFVAPAFGVLFFGCAASIPPAELIDARQAYQHATVGLAATLMPAELYRAKEALAVAERSFQESPSSARTRDLAYVARRKAMLAEVLASSAARKAATLKAKGDYQATLTAIQANKVITEARRNAATKVEQSSLPRGKESRPATTRGGQTLKQTTPKSGRATSIESSPVIKQERTGPRMQSPGSMRSARILLIDDNSGQRDSVQRILMSTDDHLVEAVDCENAIALIGNRMFDLILLGFALPNESSLRVLASLKQYQLTTRVIMIKEGPGLESEVKSATLPVRGYPSVR
jgi:hypothetical protein